MINLDLRRDLPKVRKAFDEKTLECFTVSAPEDQEADWRLLQSRHDSATLNDHEYNTLEDARRDREARIRLLGELITKLEAKWLPQG